MAAIVVAGVLAGRLGLPITGAWLLGAGLLGALPRLIAIVQRRWTTRWPELAAVLIGMAAVGGVGLALAWPSMLPLGLSVDAVHHTQLIAWMADHRAFPTPGGDAQKLLGEMAAYPVGLALLVLAAAALTSQPLLETTYPTVALLGGLIAALVVLLSSAAARGELNIENEELKTARAGRSLHDRATGAQFSFLTFLALLVGPLLLLAHRTYLMEAYIDHSYYTMVLGVLLALLAAAWLIVEPRLSWGAAAQLGLALAALMCTYPLWAPLPAALALAAIVFSRPIPQPLPPQAGQGQFRLRWPFFPQRRKQGSPLPRFHGWEQGPRGEAPSLGMTLTACALVLGPALALGLLDVMPRLGIGQKVLEHEGLVTLPTAQRLMPILLALPCVALVVLMRGSHGLGKGARKLVGLAALAGLAALGLALAARAGLAAGYHSYKLLFLLTPLAAAIVGGTVLRLTSGQAAFTQAGVSTPHIVPVILSGNYSRNEGSWIQLRQRHLAVVQYDSLAPITNAMRVVPVMLTGLTQSASLGSLEGPGSLRLSLQKPLFSGDSSAAALESPEKDGYLGRAGLLHRRVSPVMLRRWLALGVAALVLAATGSFQVVPAPTIQLLTPDMVAAARWLRASSIRDTTRMIAVGTPIGPISYWIEVGLLGQRRDKAPAALRGFTDMPPSPESWLVDQRLAPVAIALGVDQPLPGTEVLARFGRAAVVRRAKQIDPAQLNPLTIRYHTIWEDERLKSTIELQHPLPGPLPLLELRLYHDGAPVNSFALPPEPTRTRTQYLGADLLPATLGGAGYINQSAYPTFAPLAVPPTGALTLTLRLSIDGNTVDERLLAAFERTAGGRIEGLMPSNGELIYLRHDVAAGDLRGATLDFEDTLRLTGWSVPAHASPPEPIIVGLRWQAPRALDRSLFPEIQLLDERGWPVATSLSAPQGGFYPTWRWRPGESVAEQRSLQLPPDLAPGIYRVVVRVSDFVAGRTLTVGERGTDEAAQIGAIIVGR